MNDLAFNEIDIFDFLSAYKDKEIIFIPNPGNAGDSLIAYGTIQIFKKLNINYSIGEASKKYSNQTLFYGGGGNFIGIYPDCSNFLKNNKDSNEIVILPHTIAGEDELIKSLEDNVKIICREKISYTYVNEVLTNKSNLYLSKDLALYIEGLEAFKETKGEGVANCYRTDRERTEINIPADNVDLSNKLYLAGNTQQPEVIESVTLSFFKYLSNFDTINTNRLHIAIAGGLLNKKVNFYRNIYWKNKAVFDYCLEKDYPNITFHDKSNIGTFLRKSLKK